MIPNSKFQIPDSSFKIQVSRFPFQVSLFKIQDSRFEVHGSSFKTPASRFEFQDTGFTVLDSKRATTLSFLEFGIWNLEFGSDTPSTSHALPHFIEQKILITIALANHFSLSARAHHHRRRQRSSVVRKHLRERIRSGVQQRENFAGRDVLR